MLILLHQASKESTHIPPVVRMGVALDHTYRCAHARTQTQTHTHIQNQRIVVQADK